MAQLEIVIVSAQLDRVFDSVKTTQDCYVAVLSDGKEVLRTETCKDATVAPSWNEKFEAGRGSGRVVTFQLWVDHFWRSQTFCGEAEFEVDQMWAMAAQGKQQVPLYLTKKGTQTGVLLITLGMVGGPSMAAPQPSASMAYPQPQPAAAPQPQRSMAAPQASSSAAYLQQAYPDLVAAQQPQAYPDYAMRGGQRMAEPARPQPQPQPTYPAPAAAASPYGGDRMAEPARPQPQPQPTYPAPAAAASPYPYPAADGGARAFPEASVRPSVVPLRSPGPADMPAQPYIGQAAVPAQPYRSVAPAAPAQPYRSAAPAAPAAQPFNAGATMMPGARPPSDPLGRPNGGGLLLPPGGGGGGHLAPPSQPVNPAAMQSVQSHQAAAAFYGSFLARG